MSVITNKTAVAKALIPNAVDTPLDARIVVDAVSDFANIEMPYVGMIIYTKTDGKYWSVKTLKAKQIGVISVANAQIDTYEEFSSGGVTKEYVDELVGDINSVLDEINGEEV